MVVLTKEMTCILLRNQNYEVNMQQIKSKNCVRWWRERNREKERGRRKERERKRERGERGRMSDR